MELLVGAMVAVTHTTCKDSLPHESTDVVCREAEPLPVRVEVPFCISRTFLKNAL